MKLGSEPDALHDIVAEKGIITLAYGKRRYLKMARVLAESLKLHCAAMPRAIVTDSTDPDVRGLYDICVPLRPDFGGGLQQKLSLNRYSPFRQTLFVDSDCLVVRDIATLWELFTAVPVGVVGRPISNGYWFGEIADLCRQFGITAVPKLNSGMVYFDRSTQAQTIFSAAREFMEQYDALGFKPLLRGGRNDEVVLAFALAINGVGALDDGGSTMRTPLGMRGPMHIDVLRGVCRFNKEGEIVEPAIPHFCGWWARGFYYRRETLKLALAERLPVSRQVISLLVNGLCNPPHALGAAIGGPPLRRASQYYRKRKIAKLR